MKKINANKIKTWFVTGASSGVGWELCRQLLTKGYNVICVSRRIPQFNHPNCLCLSVDVTNIASVKSAIEEGIKKFGEINVVVNNAGISSNATLEEESLDHMKHVMETNFFGTFNVMHEFIPYFRKNKNGTIVNNTSQSGISYRTGGSAYCSSKHAVEGLTSVCWHETADFCRVMAVELGWFPGTDIVSQMKEWDQTTSIEEYKNLTSSHIKQSKLLHNDLEKAVSVLIKNVENEILPRRLILGKDAWEQISGECHSLKQSLVKTKKDAFSCSSKSTFFKHYGQKHIAENIDRNIALLNFHWENVNFGALLTSYALNKYLNDAGYSAKNIDYIPSFPWIPEEPYNVYFDEFRKKNMPVTKKFNAGESLDELNYEFSTFIVGSDQVWRHEFIQKDKDAYFFSFAENEKKLISYAASFGVNKINASQTDIDDYKMRISLFDSVGVREKTGVNICKDMGINAQQVCDPVFLLSSSDWSELADNYICNKEKDEVVFYTIDDELEKKISNFIEKNKEKLRYKTIKNITFNTPVEEWLYRIKNCKFFVTDSFHGSCFAIIFNKPFICINPNTNTSTRMESLFSSLGIKNRLYSDFESVNMGEVLKDNIDYKAVNEKITDLQERGREFLLTSLENPMTRRNEKEKIKSAYMEKLYQNALANKNIVLFKYIKYKILSKILWGKKRKKYKTKRKECKRLYKQMKSILKKKRGVK